MVRGSTEDDLGWEVTLSGSTCSVVVHDVKKNELWTAHVGDSTAILGKFKKTQSHPDGRLAVTELTTDHKATIPAEKKRILNSGGEIVKFEGDVN
jgi:serine/threonine protein phosphatase PrpC